MRQPVTHIAALLAGLALTAVVLWLDITTGMWQQYVILSGLTAGVITFALTVLVLDRVVARSTAQRWKPITRLALADFLHALADEDMSEISRGSVIPRTLPAPTHGTHPPTNRALTDEYLGILRSRVVEERRQLSDVLAKWSGFLASTTENETLLLRVADIAWQLDRVRDRSIEVEKVKSPEARATLEHEISLFNAHVSSLVSMIEQRLSLLDEKS